MHLCPRCNSVCTCDSDDTWEDEPQVCNHDCADDAYLFDDDEWRYEKEEEAE